MVHHIVMWKFKPEIEENKKILDEKLKKVITAKEKFEEKIVEAYNG